MPWGLVGDRPVEDRDIKTHELHGGARCTRPEGLSLAGGRERPCIKGCRKKKTKKKKKKKTKHKTKKTNKQNKKKTKQNKKKKKKNSETENINKNKNKYT
eukprot:15433488-Alexandrium_andersonii.AAC.1